MERKGDLTTGSVLSRLIGFAVPFLCASFMQAFYSAVDMWTVGHFSASSDLAAVNVGSQVLTIVTCIIIGLSMGATVRIGFAVGAKDDELAGKAVGSTVRIFIVLAAIFTPVMIIFAGPIASLIQTPQEALESAKIYIRICGIGIPFIVSYNVISAVLRGDGNSKMPMAFVAVACVFNIAGDLILTGALGMGVKGVAISTISAQLIASAAGLIYLKKKGLSFPVTRRIFKNIGSQTKDVLRIGIPIAAQDTLTNISFVAITVIANLRGITDADAVGIVEKLIYLMFLFPSAMMSALSAFVSQNIGADRPERARQALKYGTIIAAAFGILLCAISQPFNEQLAGIFTNDPAVIISAGQYLRTYSIDCFAAAFVFCINGYLCGIERTWIVFFHSTFTALAIRVPLAYVLSVSSPDSMLPMGLAPPVGSAVSVVICVIYIALVKKKKGSLIAK